MERNLDQSQPPLWKKLEILHGKCKRRPFENRESFYPSYRRTVQVRNKYKPIPTVNPHLSKINNWKVTKQILLNDAQKSSTDSRNQYPVTEPITNDQFDKMLQNISIQTEIAVDIEFSHGKDHSYYGKSYPALIQISTHEADFIICPFRFASRMKELKSIFTDDTMLKIFHGSANDLEMLKLYFGIFPFPIMDIQAAHDAFTGEILKFENITHFYIPEATLPSKDYQRADWRLRPLPNEYKEYARSDSHFILKIWNRMKTRWYESNWDQVTIKCQSLMRKLPRTKVPTLETERKSLDFDHKSQRTFETLFQLRDDLGKHHDIPPNLIIRTEYLCFDPQKTPE